MDIILYVVLRSFGFNTKALYIKLQMQKMLLIW